MSPMRCSGRGCCGPSSERSDSGRPCASRGNRATNTVATDDQAWPAEVLRSQRIACKCGKKCARALVVAWGRVGGRRLAEDPRMSRSGVQRHARLAPPPDSARTARRLVAEVLASARADDFIDSATLLTSELVTNGIVHAHTEMHVIVDATPSWVRVEVVDANPQLPSRRDYDQQASTGRGLEMVELLADDFGVEPL